MHNLRQGVASVQHRPRVQVLLATYNGDTHVAEQIDSVLAQLDVDVDLLVSDDGSSDNTRNTLSAYHAAHPGRFLLLPQVPGTGRPKTNFLRLMQASTADYVALCDQDDVWLPDKLAVSMQAMAELEQKHGSSVPLLVFTDVNVVDGGLRLLHASFWQNQGIVAERIGSLRHLLAQNVVVGCTAVMNRALVERSLDMPDAAYMHDWWIALNACVFGHARPLHVPTVLYRQHGGNAVGAVLDHRRNLVPSFRFHEKRRAQWEIAARQAAAFLALHRDEVTPAQRRVLEAYSRSDQHPNRFVRVFTYLRRGLFLKGVRPNLAMLWYLWDMKAAKRADAPATRQVQR